MTSWILLWIFVAILAGLSLWFWRRWRDSWWAVEFLVRRIADGARPRTFLVPGGKAPTRVGLALEDLFDRYQSRVQRMTERAVGAETIFAALRDGLMVIDQQGRVVLVNRVFEQFFSTRYEVMGRPLVEIIRDPAVSEVVTETLRTGQPQQGEFVVAARSDASPRRMQISAVAMRGGVDAITGVVLLFHDITQLKQTDDIRRDFVANVSHELRTPLSILRGYIETMLDDPETTPEEAARMLDVMRKHSDRLGLLVEDLLTLAQLESGNPNLHISEVRLSELFAGIVRDWGKRFADKKVSIDVAVDREIPLLAADEIRLQEVLYNLLDNALKYSAPGGRIRLQARQENDHVMMSVSDSGPGIPEDDLPRIFERFYRADKARSREQGGTGLGLAIVKHIVQMHGGRVEAESRLDQGTTIRVWLPLPSEVAPVTQT